MQNKLLAFLGLIIIIGSLFIGVRNIKKNTNIPLSSSIVSTTTDSSIATTTLNINIKPGAVFDAEKSAWNVFQQYLGFAKNHDFIGLKSVTYKTSSTCNDPSKTKECNDLMDNAYSFGCKFIEKDFKHVLFDGKQIILSTDFRTVDAGDSRGLARQVIYFTRDAGGIPKVLFFTTPDEITYTLVDKNNKAITTAMIDARLEERIKDTDQDGMPDEIETCSYQGAPANCMKTDPNKKDSLGDGWWDGVRIFIKR